MRFRERRLRFEKLEQRKVFAADIVSESLADAISKPYSSSDAIELPEPIESDGVRAAEVRIQFDPLAVQPDLSTIKAGDAWNGKASVVANVDEVAGTLVAFLFTTRPITGQGNLLELEFKSAVSDEVGVSPASIGIEQVRLNEGQIEATSDLTILAAPAQTLNRADELIASDEDLSEPLDNESDESLGDATDYVFAAHNDLAAEEWGADRESQLVEVLEGDQAAVPC
jgi:hypothetical protein